MFIKMLVMCSELVPECDLCIVFNISIRSQLKEVSDVIFNCNWLGIIQNKPIQLILASNRTLAYTNWE